MSKWEEAMLGDLIDVKHGFAFSGEYISDLPCENILLTPGNFAIGGGFKAGKFKYYYGHIPKEFLLKEGDLLITMTDLSKQSDTLGYPAFVPCEKNKKFLHNQRLGKVLLKEDEVNLDIKFLHYLLCSENYRHEILASATGTSIKHTSPERIRKFKFDKPSLPEQKAIAAILGSLDDKIELNRRMNETLEAMARAIFKDWFVDFGPTRAKQEGLPAYLPEHLWSLFPSAIDPETGLPEGWELGRLDELIVLQRGFDLPKSKREDGNFPVIAASGVNGTHKEYMVKGPGVTTGRSGVLGKVFYIQENFWPLNTSLWIKKYNNSTPIYAYFLLQTLDFDSFNAGSAVPTLNRNHVHNLFVPKPDMRLVAIFSHIAKDLFNLKYCNSENSDCLAETRDRLLPKLMSGEIRVKDAEKMVEEVL